MAELREKIAKILGAFDLADDDADVFEYADRILALPEVAEWRVASAFANNETTAWASNSPEGSLAFLKEGDEVHRPDGSIWIVGPSVKPTTPA